MWHSLKYTKQNKIMDTEFVVAQIQPKLSFPGIENESVGLSRKTP